MDWFSGVLLIYLGHCWSQRIGVAHLKTRDDPERISSIWKTQLENGGVKVQVFPVRNDEIVTTVSTEKDIMQVIDFLITTQQHVLDHFTYNSKQYYPSIHRNHLDL